MEVVVTGAAGFVGRRLIKGLSDHSVVALDRAKPNIDFARAVVGDLCLQSVLNSAVSKNCDAIVHLATVPGGAAEDDPRAAWSVNMDGTAALVDALISRGVGKRFVFASSIAVFGDLDGGVVNDDTPVRPTMLYGAHKAMAEQWLATRSRREELNSISLRLPGIVARPAAPSGMKSAFMSDVFHAALAGVHFTMPVSPSATIWLMSVGTIARNLRHALEFDGPFPEPFAVTLPAVRTSVEKLVEEIAAQTGRGTDFVSYEPDETLECLFGRLPPLKAKRAENLGFVADASLGALVEDSIRNIRSDL